MPEFDRRDFLKIIGAGAGSVAATGCYRAADLPSKLIPYVVQPEEITPGLPVVYASTCQECRAGCGLHVKTREGRPIKLEGNPEHPINRGALCARGQASIGRTYHPDRRRGPHARRADGKLAPITWDEGLAKLTEALRGAGSKVALLSGVVGPTLSTLMDQWLASLSGGTRVVYEPFSYESLRGAAAAVFGMNVEPVFDLTDSDFVIDFGADAVGTGPSPVEHARQLMAARDATGEAGLKQRLVYVGPRLDETASVSDEWLPSQPGSEGLLALAIARVAFDEARTRGEPVVDDPALLSTVLAEFGADLVAPRTGVPADTIRRIGSAFSRAKRPVALPPGVALTSRRATATNAAVLLLNAVVGAIGRSVALPPPAAGPAPSFRDVVKLIDAMKAGDVSVLVIHGSNPVYSLPPDAGFAEALSKVGLVVSTAPIPDETSERAHLVLPDHTPLESWGDAAPRPGVRSLVQPTIRPLFDTRAFGDVLLASGRALGDPKAALPKGSFHDVLQAAWSDGDWRTALQHGGRFEAVAPAPVPISSSVSRIEFKEPQLEGDGAFVLLPVPSPLLGDGRGANLGLLQEIPDPITKITWQSWVEVSKKTAESLGVGAGDVLAIETTFGKAMVPVWPRGGIRDDVIALAVGQGHTVGRYATLENDGSKGIARGTSVISLLPSLTDESGGRAWLAAKARVTSAGRHERLPMTQYADNKRGRMLGESISLAALAKGESPWAPNQLASGRGGVSGGGEEILRAYDPVDDSTADSPYRWGMTIDGDRCTGCSACVVACYVENNVAIVGEARVLYHRQMSWLRIERYVGEGDESMRPLRPGPENNEVLGGVDVRNFPLPCQQCGAATCEPVCPVLATYHSPTGLNGMIYNRCIGTRYCSNNCPYKVRRFNWFDYQIETWPEPTRLGLNPDVTVRGQGVMEKCTFCVQRIQAARMRAKLAGQTVPEDGAIETACQQTCPTSAIGFGNLKDPASAVNAMAKKSQARSYRALHVLNTRPAVSYLAKVSRVGDHGGGHELAANEADETRPEKSA